MTPKLPSKAELQRFEEAKPGSGEELIDHHFEVIRREQNRKDQELNAKLAEQRHVQRYRYFSVASGCLLALSTLGVCTYSVHQGVDITPLAWIVAPLTGLAGVFIWGYRPSNEDRTIRDVASPPRKELPLPETDEPNKTLDAKT